MGNRNMNNVTIDCSGIETARQLHEAFAAALNFPHWYGHNLDALYDCLTSLPQETEITLEAFVFLPPFSKGFLRVLMDAAEENPRLNITLL